MPYKKKYPAKRRGRKRGPRTGARITGPPRMTRQLRVQQNLTRDCRWFKNVFSISSNSSGNISVVWAPGEVTQCQDFQNWGRNWEEYKVLSYKVKLQPIAVGSESLQQFTTADGTFKRGLTLTWLDQGEPDTSFNNVEDIIVRPSCRTVTPRKVHFRWATRPRGNPEWGALDNQGQIAPGAIIPNITPVTRYPPKFDSWQDSRIRLWGEGYTPITSAGTQLFFYATVYYKVLFRGRQQNHLPTGFKGLDDVE